MNMRKRLLAGLIIGMSASSLGLASIHADAATTTSHVSTAAAKPEGGGCWKGGCDQGRHFHCFWYWGWGPGPYGPYDGWHRHCEFRDDHGDGWDDSGGGRDDG